MPLPEEFIYQLKLANPIESTIGNYINLLRRGKDYVALCPFHSEKTPSFHVYTDTQSFYCFGCGAGGDVITFTKKIENLEYIETIKLLAQKGGLDVPENDTDNRAANLKKRILEINRETANYYFKQLVSGDDKKGLKYFVDRGLKPETIKKYGLGYAPASWDGLYKHLSKSGYSNEEMIAAGVRTVSRNNNNVYDTFRERVIFPIIDLRGNVIAFGGRTLGNGIPKYLNTGDTPVFKKSRNLFSFMTKNTVSYSNNAELLLDDLKSYRKNGFRTVLLCDNQKMAENTSELLSENQIPSVILQKENTGDSQKELTVITYGMKIPGYELTVSKFAALSLCEKGTAAGDISYPVMKVPTVTSLLILYRSAPNISFSGFSSDSE